MRRSEVTEEMIAAAAAQAEADDAVLFRKLRALGGRLVDCPHGYRFHDSCPTCDNIDPEARA